jgi:ATP-dependent protease ClpP protease subunit
MGGMMGGEPESGMSINTSMDTKTGRKTVTVTADGEAAEELAQMLKMAGMAGSRPEPEHKHIGVVIGGSQEVDEEYANEPDVKMASTRAIMQQGNDLNRPKTQYKHSYRGGDNPMSMKEDKLFKLYDAMKSR